MNPLPSKSIAYSPDPAEPNLVFWTWLWWSWEYRSHERHWDAGGRLKRGFWWAHNRGWLKRWLQTHARRWSDGRRRRCRAWFVVHTRFQLIVEVVRRQLALLWAPTFSQQLLAEACLIYRDNIKTRQEQQRADERSAASMAKLYAKRLESLPPVYPKTEEGLANYDREVLLPQLHLIQEILQAHDEWFDAANKLLEAAGQPPGKRQARKIKFYFGVPDEEPNAD